MPAFRMPRKTPYLVMACRAYSEQLGVKRQEEGRRWRQNTWYPRISLTITLLNMKHYSLFLPLRRRRDKFRRPAAEAIFLRNPCRRFPTILVGVFKFFFIGFYAIPLNVFLNYNIKRFLVNTFVCPALGATSPERISSLALCMFFYWRQNFLLYNDETHH